MTTKYVEVSYCDYCGEELPIRASLKIEDESHYFTFMNDGIELELCSDCMKELVNRLKQKKDAAKSKAMMAWDNRCGSEVRE